LPEEILTGFCLGSPHPFNIQLGHMHSWPRPAPVCCRVADAQGGDAMKRANSHNFEQGHIPWHDPSARRRGVEETTDFF